MMTANRKHYHRAVLGVVALLGATSFHALAEEQDKGLAIMIEADRRDRGFEDSQSEMDMILRNRAGSESRREMRTMIKEVQGDGDKSVIVFDEPKDVEGTASLTYSHSTQPDEQWLYLPAIKRVKRISSKNKSGPFMGSEFAFEDISSQELDKYSYRYVRDEQVDGTPSYVVEAVPEYPDSGYSRLVMWIDQEEYRHQKTDYYDRKGALLKTLTYDDYERYLDKFWRAGTMEMVNHQTGKSTTLLWNDYRFQVGIDDSMFESNSLRRVR